jgi:hypothetical protein
MQIKTAYDAVISYFLDDPMKLLYAIGGAGGLIYWIDRFRNRTRVKIQQFSEAIASPTEPQIRFEGINLGVQPTSLEPIVILNALTLKREPKSVTLRVTCPDDRSLPPHVPKRFIAATGPDDLSSLFYKTYAFVPTRGRKVRVRVRDAGGVVLIAPKFLLERILFRRFEKAWLVFRGREDKRREARRKEKARGHKTVRSFSGRGNRR